MFGSIAPPRFPHVLIEWTADPVVLVSLAAGAIVYEAASRRLRRLRGRGVGIRRRAGFFGGLVALAVATASPIDRYAEVLFSVHMTQHLIIVLIAAPLLLVGAPIRTLVAAAPSRDQARLVRVARSPIVGVVTHPVVCWTSYVAAMWATHYSGLYESALRSEIVHAGEHALYLAAGLAFWHPVIGTEPTRRRLSPPVRIGYLFLAVPANAALGASIATAGRVLYPSYAAARGWGPSPLADQQAAGAVMWIGDGLAMLVAVLVVAARWAAQERKLTGLLEARPGAESAAGSETAAPSFDSPPTGGG